MASGLSNTRSTLRSLVNRYPSGTGAVFHHLECRRIVELSNAHHENPSDRHRELSQLSAAGPRSAQSCRHRRSEQCREEQSPPRPAARLGSVVA
jgi:hypothetical protein